MIFKMKNALIFLAVSLMAALPAAGQDTQGNVRTWTLQECIDYAISNNISLRQSRNNYLSGLEDTEQAKAALFPTVNASSSQGITNRPFSDSGSSSVVGSNVYSTFKKTNYSGNYGINANMTLYNGGSLKTAIKQQELQNEIDSLSISENTNDIVISIIQAYMQCLCSAEAVTVSESNAEAAKAELDRAREMKNAGELSKVDVSQLESQYASDLYQITTAKVNLDNNKLLLKQLLELGISEDIELAQPADDEALVLKILPSKEVVYDNALAAMPEIRRAGLNVNAADLAIQQARTGFLPTLSANAGIGTTNVSGSGLSIGSQIEKNFNESIGLNLNIPIFQGRRNKTAVNKARIAADNSKLEQLSIEKNLLKEVENTYLDAISAQSQYLSAKEQVKYAEQSYEYISEAFKVGKKNTVELITAQNSLLSARVALLQAKYTALLNNALLDIYQGNYSISE